MFRTNSLLASTLLALATVEASALPSTVSNSTQACNTYVVPEVQGGFTQHAFTDFSGVTPGQNAVSFLNANGFAVSSYSISSGPIPRAFAPANVNFGSGTLNLKVNAYPGSGSIIGAEIATNDRFMYASVRTVQKSSSVRGVVEGNFFYASDNQEVDWEILTATIDTSSQCVAKGIWATNQALVSGQPSTHTTVPFPFDPRAGFHEYRIDWIPGATVFYLDGGEVARLTSNVPNVSGPWIWNVWSNGDACWSAGPPNADSISQIRSIEIYKGYTAKVSSSSAVCVI